MSFVAALITVLLVALVCWVIASYGPPVTRTPALAVLVVALVVWALLLLFPGLAHLRVG